MNVNVRIIGRIFLCLYAIIGWFFLFYFIFLANFGGGKVILNYNYFGEMFVETWLILAIFVLTIIFSIIEIKNISKDLMY